MNISVTDNAFQHEDGRCYGHNNKGKNFLLYSLFESLPPSILFVLPTPSVNQIVRYEFLSATQHGKRAIMQYPGNKDQDQPA